MLRIYHDFLSQKQIVLASGSPRRKEILDKLGLNVEVEASNVSEDAECLISCEGYTMALATEKAQHVRERRGIVPFLVIGADTIVVANGNKLLGKPLDKEHAMEMLRQLSGLTHNAITGVCLLWGEGPMVKFHETTKVKMSELTDDEIKAYVDTGESLDKAGAYGIQGLGGTFVEGIEGDFYNVVGFPLNAFCRNVVEHMKQIGRPDDSF